jgi:hypothetical protein
VIVDVSLRGEPSGIDGLSQALYEQRQTAQAILSDKVRGDQQFLSNAPPFFDKLQGA